MVTCKFLLPNRCLHVAEMQWCLQARPNEYLAQLKEEDTNTELWTLLNQLLHCQKDC